MKSHPTALLFLLAAAGCAQTMTQQQEAHLGDAVRESRLAMTIDPGAAQRIDDGKGIDGRAAQEGIKRYQNSFKEPPPVTNVINIGGGFNGGSGAK